MEKTKNCWLIPTQEQSNLILDKENNNLFFTTSKNIPLEYQFIYITDNSEIEVNNNHVIWIGKDNIPYLKKVLERRGYTKNAFEFLCKGHKFDAWYDADKLKKVILTNDPNLKNVQQLTEEQLIEYVSNPVDCCEVNNLFSFSFAENSAKKE